MKNAFFSRNAAAFVSALVLASLPAVVQGSNAPKAAVEADKVTPDGDPIICRKVAETGSLVKKSKKCYTRAQWERIAEAARARAERLRSDNASGVTTN